MLSKRSQLFIALVCAFALSCGSTTEPDNSDSNSANNASTADAGNNAMTDGDTDVAEEGALELGTNAVSQATPDNFMPLMDGSEVPIVWGVQGSWMVVLAFRTQNLIDGAFDVRASIEIDGAAAGDIWLEFQETFPGGDGWDYYYNLFLALDSDEAPVQGTPATIVLSVEDENGTMAEQRHDVFVGETVGGPNG